MISCYIASRLGMGGGLLWAIFGSGNPGTLAKVALLLQ